MNMDIHTIEILSITIYKVICLLSGVLLTYMGYKLFMHGIWGHAGNAEAEFGNNRVLVKKAAPGTFFVLAGTLVIGITIYKGLELNTTIDRATGSTYEKPILPD